MDRSYTEEQTGEIAEKVLGLVAAYRDKASVVCLQGDLGAGKTTLTKAIAQLLGIQETVVSPTFVIAKFYTLGNHAEGQVPLTQVSLVAEYPFVQLIHVDAYRIDDIAELGPLHWDTLLQMPNTLIIVEWPERITAAIPETAIHFSITHNANERHIRLSSQQ